MKKYWYILTMLLCAVSYNAISQISFTYDADGNMSSRTVVMLKSADFYTLEENVEGEEIVPEIVSA
ncbi:MAG: hypothetical protein LBM68_03220, partial [Bacteroidales bacterium]|nr:hypothetical protein [Bacteroidales bacterium]